MTENFQTEHYCTGTARWKSS